MSEVNALLRNVDQLFQRLYAIKYAGTNGIQRMLQDSTPIPVSNISAGNTSWMMFSSAIVLFMTMPGLAIYYGGLVKSKNVLAVAMQCLSITCLITFLWLACGYSLAFTPTNYYPSTMSFDEQKQKYAVYGNGSRLWLRGMTLNSITNQATSIPESVYCMFQLTFAIISAALICGSFADRMKYWPMMLFMACWHVAVYCPLAHSMWHLDGVMFNLGVADYAGGNVVHIASGVSGLVAALIVGNRQGWSPKESTHKPHNILLTFMGMSMLWVGWFGFNAVFEIHVVVCVTSLQGSAGGASTNAGYALLATQIATATASLSWMITETVFRKKPSVLGMVNGAVAGLVCITPGCGYVDMNGAFFFGLIGGVGCYFGAQLKFYLFKIDDALDAFGIHAIGGIIGGILTGFFANPAVSAVMPPPNESRHYTGVFYGNTDIGGHQLAYQIAGILYSITWAAVASYIILKVIDLTIGLRVSQQAEEEGLDVSIHGETIVNPAGEVNSDKSKAVGN